MDIGGHWISQIVTDIYEHVSKGRHSAPPLLNSRQRPPQEAGMFIWIVILAMALVGGYWVKARRQRKTKAAMYASN